MMNRTNNYNLCQFEETDRVQRTDFNEDNAKIDGALAGKAERTEVSKLEKSIASVAATASTERIRVGSFVGDGTDTRTVFLPWAPTFAFLSGSLSDYVAPFFLTQGHCQYVGEYEPGRDGTYTPQLSGSRLILNSWANKSGITTYYVLFR